MPVKQDLTLTSYSVVNPDSVTHNFPQDFLGKVTLMSYIYTHCPDVCPMITANMKTVAHKLGPTNQVQFVGISFDPKRDTPQVLKKYAYSYELVSEIGNC